MMVVMVLMRVESAPCTHPANDEPQASLKLCREMRLDTLRTWMAGCCSVLALKLNPKPRLIPSALLGVLLPDPLAAKLSDENLSDGEVCRVTCDASLFESHPLSNDG
jgi:hypothetical protein